MGILHLLTFSSIIVYYVLQVNPGMGILHLLTFSSIIAAVDPVAGRCRGGTSHPTPIFYYFNLYHKLYIYYVSRALRVPFLITILAVNCHLSSCQFSLKIVYRGLFCLNWRIFKTIKFGIFTRLNFFNLIDRKPSLWIYELLHKIWTPSASKNYNVEIVILEVNTFFELQCTASGL